MFSITLKSLDKYILSLLFSIVLIFTWAHFFVRGFQLLVVCLIVIRLCLTKIKYKSGLFNSLIITLLIILLIINVTLTTGNHLTDNLKILFLNTIIFIYASFLIKNEKQFLQSYFRKILIPINIYSILNICVMILQCRGTYFLMDTNNNSFYKDHIAGFIGADGTHCVSIFTAFVIVLNLIFIKEFHGRKKRLLKLYNIITIIVSLGVSTQNDNNSMFIIIPLTIVIYYYLTFGNSTSAVLKKMWKPMVILVAFVLFFMLLMKSDNSELVSVQNRLKQTIGTYSIVGNRLVGADERAIYFSLAIEEGSMFGKGWGSIQMLSEPSIHKHFGMASVQPLIYMGGICFYLIYILILARRFSGNNLSRKLLCYIILFFVISYFTQIFVVFRVSIFMSIYCIPLSFIEKAPKKLIVR